MRILKTLIGSMAITAMASTGFAGGLSPEVMEAPVVIQEVEEPAASSINPLFVVAGVVAALLIVAALEEDDDEEDNRGTIQVIETGN